MENWKDLYLELGGKIKDGVEAIKHVDLWHNQVNFLEEEHPFPAPAVFLSFRTLSTEDLSDNIQNADTQIDVYLFYETFLDTFIGAYNTFGAVSFLDNLTEIHKLLHGTSGDNYSELRRVSFSPVDTGSAQNLYRQSFVCLVTDSSAKPVTTEVEDDTGITITDEEIIEVEVDDGIFVIDPD